VHCPVSLFLSIGEACRIAIVAGASRGGSHLPDLAVHAQVRSARTPNAIGRLIGTPRGASLEKPQAEWIVTPLIRAAAVPEVAVSSR